MVGAMTITIDGKPCACDPGEYLLDVASRNGIAIPTLCHHEGLRGRGCCRVCIVEVETGNRRRIVTACVYPVERECAVFTNNENISRQRGMVLCLLRSLAPESAEVARLCEEYGAPEYDRLLTKNGEKCILCGLCVKACESLGTGAIGTAYRGVLKAVATPFEEPSIACVGCASCAKVCPTGAIEVVEDDENRTIWKKSLPLKRCAGCGSALGTYMELWRAAAKMGAEPADFCDACKKKAISDVMAETYGAY